MRHAVVDLKTGKVTNITEIEDGDGSTPEDGFVFVASDTAAIGDGWDGAQIIPAPPPVIIPDWKLRQTQAVRALIQSDYVAVRCVKAGIPYPQEWQDRDLKLRDIVRAEDGDASAELPPAPTKPGYR